MVATSAVELRRPTFHSLAEPTVESVTDLLQKRSKATEVYRLTDLKIGSRFQSERAFSTGRQATFTPHTFRKFCATVGVPSDLVMEEMGRGNTAQKRMTELVNDRLIRPEYQGHRFLFDSETSTVEGIYGPDYQRLPNLVAFETLLAGLQSSKEVVPTIQRFALEGTQMRADIVFGGAQAYRSLSPAEQETFRRNDIINFGTSLANSEDTNVVFSLSEFLYRLICTNGCILPMASGEVRRVQHKGRAFGARVMAAILEVTGSVGNFSPLTSLRDTPLLVGEVENFRGHVARRFSDRFALNALEEAQDEAQTYGTTLTRSIVQQAKSASSAKEKVAHVTVPSGPEVAMSMYNLWNGITAAARTSASLAMRTRAEQFGGEFIRDWKKYTRVPVKNTADEVPVGA